MENAQQIIETAKQHRDKTTLENNGFNVFPGDAVLINHNTDEQHEYRAIQFFDIKQQDPVIGLVVEYLVTETDIGTYSIEHAIDTSYLPPDTINSLFDSSKPSFVYTITRVNDDTFDIHPET